MALTTAQLHSVLVDAPTNGPVNNAAVPASTTQRATYRAESSISPAGRQSWSRSLSRFRDSSRARLTGRDASRDGSKDNGNAEEGLRGKSQPATRRDIRQNLPPLLSRFLGWRLEAKPPHKALFAWQDRVPRRLESLFLGCLASFSSIIAVESINIKSGLFQDWGGAPLIVASLGATAVLLFGPFESPLSQPRNVVGGQFLSALTSVIINRLFQLNSAYSVVDPAPTNEFSRLNWLAAALSMSVSLAVMELTGTVHPPGGATALIVSIQPSAVHLHFRFLLVILASSLIMTGFALLFNNLGHRRYPVFWFTAAKPAQKAEEQGRSGQADLELERKGFPLGDLGSRERDQIIEAAEHAEEDTRGRQPGARVARTVTT